MESNKPNQSINLTNVSEPSIWYEPISPQPNALLEFSLQFS